MSCKYPIVLPGGSLPLAWQLKHKRVVLVGGGEVAAGRLVNVLQADALVTLIAPSAHLNAEVRHRIHEDPLASPRITYLDRPYAGPEDLHGAHMVLTAIDDNETSMRIWRDAKDQKIPINVADVPPNCDFYFGSLIRRGPLQVLVSTNGKGPKLANIIRRRLEEAIPPNVELAIENVGVLRERLRGRAPGVGGTLGRDRMRWMSRICELWTLEELARLDEGGIETLLEEGWEKRKALTYRDVYKNPGVLMAMSGAIERFDSWWRAASGAHWFASGLVVGGLGTWFIARRQIW